MRRTATWLILICSWLGSCSDHDGGQPSWAAPYGSERWRQQSVARGEAASDVVIRSDAETAPVRHGRTLAAQSDSSAVEITRYLPVEVAHEDISTLPQGRESLAKTEETSRGPARWYAEVQRRIRHSQYSVRVTPDGSLRSSTPSQNLRAHFDDQGVTVSPGVPVENFELHMRLAGWGREAGLEAAWDTAPVLGRCNNPTIVDERGHCLPDVEYMREGILESWTNSPAGLEHRFVIDAEPPGTGSLVVDIEIGGVGVELRTDGRAIVLTTANGSTLNYSELEVWDADGKQLPAHFARSPTGCLILVDVSSASWPVTVDPLLTGVEWSGGGDQTSALYGYSVASAGDVNGDGHDDVIVGAPYYDNNETNEGAAFVYLGGSTGLATSAAWIGESDLSGANFGKSVASAGDVNNDGYDDLIVGAPWYTNDTGFDGAVFVYLGSDTAMMQHDTTIVSEADGAWFGWAVAPAGDIDGDGHDDVLVGAPYDANGQLDEGRAYVYPGSSNGVGSTAIWTGESDRHYAGFGWALAPLGDIDGNGHGDIAVGAPFLTNGQVSEGRVYVFLGNESGLESSASWTAEGEQSFAEFGRAVGGAGDVNGDGYADLAIGAPYYTNVEDDEGAVYLYHGSDVGFQSSADWMVEGDQPSAWFGWSVASAGDLNKDTYGELIVGAYGWHNGETDVGGAFVYVGSASGLEATPGWTAEGDQANGWFGYSVACAGDINNDTYPDVVVGASHCSDGSPSEGCAFLFLGGAADSDGDGYTEAGGDCDDSNASVHPGATELCDLTDADCDGSLADGFWDNDDDGVPDCADLDDDNDCACDDGSTHASGPGIDLGLCPAGCTGAEPCPFDPDTLTCPTTDIDDDGVADYLESSVARIDPNSHPGANELCDGLDNDSNGSIDEGTFCEVCP